MDVQPIASQGRDAQFGLVEQARKLAESQRLLAARSNGAVETPTVAPVVTNATFSPALFAQAAQFQLYTQSGTLASMLSQQGAVVNSNESTKSGEESNEIHAVEESQGATLDTRA